jgi:hypothetical protein
MKLTDPKNENERRYVGMIRRFIDLVSTGENPRRRAALAGEMDRMVATIGKDRALELDHAVLLAKTPRGCAK